MIRILFVCTGNSCRSPMAEALLEDRMPRSWRGGMHVSSAGTAAADGMPAASSAVAVLAEIGIDLSRHRSRLLSARMIEESDLVVAMEQDHRDEILALAPGSSVLVLGELDPERDRSDVDDPIGGDEDVYRGTRDEIDGLIGRLVDYLAERFELEK